MSSCKICLDNHQNMYYAGEAIEGRIICSMITSEIVRGIEITLTGEEQNEWFEVKTYFDHDEILQTRLIQYWGQNTFLAMENKLSAERNLDSGTFEFAFTFKLPLNIPGTFQGPYGGVSFSVTAKMDRLSELGYTDNMIINVVSPIDLNGLRDQLQLGPVTYSQDGVPWCYFCYSSLVTMEVHLEKEVFVPGETAKIKVNITSKFDVYFQGIDVDLTAMFESKITSPHNKSKYDTKILTRTSYSTGGLISAFDCNTYNLDLIIPENAPVPNFSLCTLFKFATHLKVTAKMGICYDDMNITIPVTLGHIPVYGYSIGQPENHPYQPFLFNQASTPYPHSPLPILSQPTVAAGQIGFILSERPRPYPPSNALPYPPAGPTAPPLENSSSTPTNDQATEGGSEAVDPVPPPTYEEAMSYSPKK